MTRIQSSVCVSMDSQKNTQLSSGHCTKSLVFLMIYLNGLNARWNSPASSGVGKADGWRHPPRQRHIGWTLKIRWNYCVFTSGRSLGWQELPRTEPPEMDHSHFIFTIFIQFRCDYIYISYSAMKHGDFPLPCSMTKFRSRTASSQRATPWHFPPKSTCQGSFGMTVTRTTRIPANCHLRTAIKKPWRLPGVENAGFQP